MKLNQYVGCALLTVIGLAGLNAQEIGQTAAADAGKTAKIHMEAASVLLKAQPQKIGEAREEYRKALALPGLPVSDRVKILNLAADLERRLGKAGSGEAMRLYELLASDPEAPNKDRIAALNGLANAMIAGMAGLNLDEMDMSKVEAVLRRAMELPGLKPDEAVEAWVNLGKMQERQDHFADARQSYEKISQVDPSDKAKSLSQRLITSTMLGEGKVKETIALYKQYGYELAPLYQAIGDTAKLREDCLATLNNSQTNAKVRWTAFTRLPSWNGTQYKELQEDGEKWLPEFLAADPNQALQLLRKFKEATKTAPAFVEWAAPLLLEAPRLSSNEYALVRQALVQALVDQGKIKQASDTAASLAGDDKLAAPLRFQSRLTAAALKSVGGKDLKRSIEEAAQGFVLTGPEKAQGILDAARLAMTAGNEPSARGLYDAYQHFYVHPERATLACTFVEKAPIDVGAWLASPWVKDPKRAGRLNRPYGDNLKFLLETDSAVTSRNIGPDAGGDADAENRTDFYALCDTEGVHLFFMAWDPKTAEVVNGFATGGSYEGYLAPGRYQPYTFFSIDLPGGHLNDQFLTMYPNRFFRAASSKSGTVKTETHAVEGGFATTLFFSWEAFYDRLPGEGDAWAFENIRWTRAGGRSFGGSESVHNPSSWGDLVFSGLSPENRRAIKRRLVIKAAASYTRMKRDPAGPVSWWSDRDLGDPEFYDKALRPLVERLDVLARQVSGGMTPEQVDLLFDQAVPGWLELPHLAAGLRRDYLAAKLTTADSK